MNTKQCQQLIIGTGSEQKSKGHKGKMGFGSRCVNRDIILIELKTFLSSLDAGHFAQSQRHIEHDQNWFLFEI